jgi:magnesium transporter
MIHYYAKEKGLLVELAEPEVGCWINLTAPFAHGELEDFAEKLLIPLDFLTDPLDIDERTRYEREDDARLIVINTPVVNNGIDKEADSIYITVPIGIILTIDHLVTISGFENPVIERFLSGRVKNFDPHDERLFILQMFEQNTQRFLQGLKKLNHRRSSIEKDLYGTGGNVEIKQLLSIEKALVYFVNALNANELLMMKIKRIDFLHIRGQEEKEELLEDIIVDNNQALEMAKIYTSILGGTMNAYHSIVSNNLNTVMKRLTTITIVLMVPTLVASFFGMNVTIPFAADHSGSFYAICLISVMLSAATSWFFRKQFN